MTKTTSTRYDVAEHLRTPEEMAAHLEACLEEENGGAAFIFFSRERTLLASPVPGPTEVKTRVTDCESEFSAAAHSGRRRRVRGRSGGPHRGEQPAGSHQLAGEDERGCSASG